MVQIQTKTTDYETIPGGTYPGIFKEIEERTNDKGPYYMWRFEVTGRSGKTADIVGMSPTSFGPRAKAFQWAGAIRGADYQPGEVIDTDQLKGRPCQVAVTVEPRRDGQGNRNNIVAIYPAAGGVPASDDEPF